MTQEALKLALDALELVNIEFVCNGAHHAKKDRHSLDEDCPVTMRYQTAITAIKEALAQPDQDQDEVDIRSRLYQRIHELETQLAQPEQEPVANGKLKVTLQDTPTEIELAQYKRMFETACAELGAINEALGLDPNDGGAEPILFAIEELRGRSQEPVAWMVYTLDGTSVCVTDNPADFTPEHRALPLYTTPTQRSESSGKPSAWVGLTDEEIKKMRHLIDWTAGWSYNTFARAIETKLKEKNT